MCKVSGAPVIPILFSPFPFPPCAHARAVDVEKILCDTYVKSTGSQVTAAPTPADVQGVCSQVHNVGVCHWATRATRATRGARLHRAIGAAGAAGPSRPSGPI
jgi:hypothetical protein